MRIDVGVMVLGVGMMVLTPLHAAENAGVRKVKWKDLQAKYEFEDPFAALSEEQLLNLGLISRLRSLEDSGGKSRVTDAMRTRAAEARRTLESQKVDVEGLFAKRKKIAEERRKWAGAAVPALDGKKLALSGFVLPLEYEGTRVAEFLLVPWVGACIHTPPPPPNQIVHVVAKTPFETKGLFEAVTVTAVMKTGKRTSELFLVDGTADINMSYSMPAAEVVKYKEK